MRSEHPAGLARSGRSPDSARQGRLPGLARLARRAAVAAGVAATLVMGSLGGAWADPGKPDETRDIAVGTKLAARTHPAVHLLSLDYTATVTVPTAGTRKAFTALYDKAAKHARKGRIPSDRRSMVKWVFQQVAADVDRYLSVAKPVRSVEATAGSWCTGWWITPDGYMVTAAHCVDTTDAELRAYFAAQSLTDVNARDVKALLKQLMGSVEPDKELTELVQKVYTTFNTKHMEVKNLKQSLDVIFALPGGGMDRTAKRLPIRLVAKGTVYPGKDHALLKLDGARNLPVITLGTDGDAQVGDVLYVNGFPGLVTNATFVSLETKLYPALTEGAFNARRETDQGVPYIQAQAPSYGGNSGGPVFNADGKAIGILVGGLLSDLGESQENQSWILPVGVLREFLAAQQVVAAPSPTTVIYDRALDDFFADRHTAALAGFRQVATLYPAHPYVAQYIADSQEAIAAGRDRTPPSQAPVPGAVGTQSPAPGTAATAAPSAAGLPSPTVLPSSAPASGLSAVGAPLAPSGTAAPTGAADPTAGSGGDTTSGGDTAQADAGASAAPADDPARTPAADDDPVSPNTVPVSSGETLMSPLMFGVVGGSLLFAMVALSIGVSTARRRRLRRTQAALSSFPAPPSFPTWNNSQPPTRPGGQSNFPNPPWQSRS
ncbi:hypothetical protein GCM10010517_25630 [Streptosporangium fragile]|uniref:Serine protease n=1 Tax=Streptosporangium fragile TaxID=46186 RepID=A0ABP6IBN8_9ACTN